MRDIIRHILKEETNLQKKVKSMIDELGFLKTATAVGGMSNLLKILGEEYLTKDKKISLISDIAAKYGTRGDLYLGDFELEVSLGKDVYSDGSYIETFVYYVDDDDAFYYKTWEFDDWGDMFDEPIDEGYDYLNKLSEFAINEILDKLLKEFFL